MKVGIIGGGISGLSLGYFLTKKGHQVFLFEKEKELGGLLSFLKKKEWSWTLEKFFHHFFSSDKELIELLKNLNLKEKIFFKRVKTSLFLNGKICQFDSPESLLRFPFFSFFEKIKTGLITFFLKYPPFFPFFGEKKAMEELGISVNFARENFTDTEKLIYSILTENTGKHMLDSGGENGPRNQRLDGNRGRLPNPPPSRHWPPAPGPGVGRW